MGEEEAYDRLVAACPSMLLAADLDGFVRAFEEEDAPDRFVRLSALAHHLVTEVAAGRTDEAASVLAAAEDLLVSGDPTADEVVRLGLFEPLQNICSHDDVVVGADAFVRLLGPAGVTAWRRLDETWSRADRLGDAGPRVRVEDYERVSDPSLRRYLQASRRRTARGVLIGAADALAAEQISGSPRTHLARVVVAAAVVVVLLGVVLSLRG